MNPHLKYGQSIPGLLPGARQGIIETVTLARDVLDSVALLKSSSSWGQDRQARLQTWFQDYERWLDKSLLGWLEARRDNNHGTYFDLQKVCYLRFIGESEKAKKQLEKKKP